MPSAITSNFEIEESCLRNNIPLVGIYFKDLLPEFKQQGGYIFNLADHDDPNGGTHWTAAWVEGKQNNYFDPFGIAPPENIKSFLRRYEYSTLHVQNINSYICGYYCLYFLFFMSRKQTMSADKRFQAFLSLWDHDPEKNRSLLADYLKAML